MIFLKTCLRAILQFHRLVNVLDHKAVRTVNGKSANHSVFSLMSPMVLH